MFLGNSAALPDPVYLVLQLLKMERALQGQRNECRSLEEKVSEHNLEMEKAKKEREFEVAKLKKDVKVIQERLDSKVKELEEKNPRKDERHHGKNGMSKMADELKEDMKKMKDDKEKVGIFHRFRFVVFRLFHTEISFLQRGYCL